MDQKKRTTIRKRSSAKEHRFVRENLSAFLDGALPQRDMERIRQHLAVCATCRQEAETLEATIRLLHALPRERLPRSFTLAPSAVRDQQRVRRIDSLYGALRVASVALACLLVVLFSGERLITARGGLFGGAKTRSEQVAMVREEPDHAFAPAEETLTKVPLRVMAFPEKEEQAVSSDSEAMQSPIPSVSGYPLATPSFTPFPSPQKEDQMEALAASVSVTRAPTLFPESVMSLDVTATVEEEVALALEAPETPLSVPPLGTPAAPLSVTEQLAQEPTSASGGGGMPPTPMGPTPQAAPFDAVPTTVLPEPSPEAAERGLSARGGDAVVSQEAAPAMEPTPLREVWGGDQSATRVDLLQTGLRQAVMVIAGLFLLVLGGLIWVWHLRRTW